MVTSKTKTKKRTAKKKSTKKKKTEVKRSPKTSRKKKRVYRCSACGNSGHNAATCEARSAQRPKGKKKRASKKASRKTSPKAKKAKKKGAKKATPKKRPSKTQPKRHRARKAVRADAPIPMSILDAVRAYSGGPIPLDPASSSANPTQAEHYCIRQPTAADELSKVGVVHIDGLEYPWHDHALTFVRPPFGQSFSSWCEKIHSEAVLGASIIALLPCEQSSSHYWQEGILTDALDAVTYVRGNVKLANGYSYRDSQILGFNVDADSFARFFSPLGKTYLMRGPILAS